MAPGGGPRSGAGRAPRPRTFPPATSASSTSRPTIPPADSPSPATSSSAPAPARRAGGPEGGSAVIFPARVLRIDDGDPGGLLADVIAADINKLPAADKSWRQWRLRRVPDAQRRSSPIPRRGCNTSSNGPANASNGWKNSLP